MNQQPQPPMNVQVSDADKEQLVRLGEQFNFLLKKYEGYALNIITTLYHKNGKMESLVRIDLGKVINTAPAPQKSPLAI